MRSMIALLLTCVFACTNLGQDSAPDVGPVAVASIHVRKHNFRSGEDIEVTILLEAGSGGLYIPKGWGKLGGGIPGFSVMLTTLSGKPVQTCGSASDAWSNHETDAAMVLNRDFIHLPEHNIIGLKTAIVCPTRRHGKYLINASYSPFHVDSESVARLPETHGLVLQRVVEAKPITISIY